VDHDAPAREAEQGSLHPGGDEGGLFCGEIQSADASRSVTMFLCVFF